MSAPKATRRFKRFHERAPFGAETGVVEMSGPVDVALVGDMAGIIYIAKGDGKKYIHQFKKTARPLLYVSSDGRHAFILGGGFRFTDRGFTDTASRKRKAK